MNVVCKNRLRYSPERASEKYIHPPHTGLTAHRSTHPPNPIPHKISTCGLLDTPGIPARDRVHEARTMVFTEIPYQSSELTVGSSVQLSQCSLGAATTPEREQRISEPILVLRGYFLCEKLYTRSGKHFNRKEAHKCNGSGDVPQASRVHG